jgi:hypothetical protein
MYKYVYDLSPYQYSYAQLPWVINYNYQTESYIQIS